MKKLLYLIAEDSYFYTHRLNLATAAVEAGFKVAVATRCQHYKKQIEDKGIQVYPLKHFSRAKTNPLEQVLSLWELFKIYRDFRPDIVHHVAMKPVVFGTMVGKICGVSRIVNAFGGLGYLFTESDEKKKNKFNKKNILRFIVSKTLKFLLRDKNTVLILQNEEDVETLVNEGCVQREKIHLIQGSGINLNTFTMTPLPEAPPVIVTCVSRVLWDKGMNELVGAANILQKQKCPIEIRLYGAPDPENPTSVPLEQLQSWVKQGLIKWFGHTEEVAQVYSECHIAILPSYREGLPKSLLEAASCGRAIIATDVPGCRSVVQNGENGWLVPAKDSFALAKAIEHLSMDLALCFKMGQLGRKRIESFFSDGLIHQQMLTLYHA